MAVTLIVLGNKEELNGVFAVSKSNVISAYVPLTLSLNKLGIDNFKVSKVFIAGKLVAENGRYLRRVE